MAQLTYSDIPLLYDYQNAAQSFLDQFQKLEDLISEIPTPRPTSPPRRLDGTEKNVQFPRYNWPNHPPLRVNQLYWPSGASRFSFGLFLIGNAGITALKSKECSLPGQLIARHPSRPDGAGVTGSDMALTTTFQEMYYLTPHRIAGCDNVSDLWLLPLVDRRYWWQFLGTEKLKDVLQEKDQYCQTICKAEWNDLLAYIAEQITESFSPGNIPAAYGKPDCREFLREYFNLPQFMDATAASVGKRVVSNLDGSISFQSPQEANGVLTENLLLMDAEVAGTDCHNMKQLYLPQNVRVTFPVSFCYHLSCDGEKYAVDISITSKCPKIGYTKTIHSTAIAEYDCECENLDSSGAEPGRGDPSNKAELEALANRIAYDWSGWREHSYDFTYSSIRNWKPTGFDDHILWSFGREAFDCYEPVTSYMTGRTGEAREPEVSLDTVYRREHQTRVQSLPLTCDVESMYHGVGPLVLPDTVLIKVDDCWEQDTECCDTDAKWLTTKGTVHFWCECDYTENPSYELPIYTSLSHLCEAFPELVSQVQSGGPIPVLDNCCEFLWAKWNCDESRWHVEAKYDDMWRFQLAEDLCRGECAEAYLLLAPCRGTPAITPITFEVCDTLNLICPPGSSAPPSTRRVFAEDCIVPGATTGTAKVATWDSNSGKYVPGDTTVTVNNEDCLIIALPGESFDVDWPPATGSGGGGEQPACVTAGTKGVARFWPDTCQFEIIGIDQCSGVAPEPDPSSSSGEEEPDVVYPSRPHGLTRRVLIDHEIDCDESSTVKLLTNSSSIGSGSDICEWTYDEEDICEVTVCNTSNRPLGCDADEYATVHFAPGECIGWLIPNARPLEAKAKLFNGNYGGIESGMCEAGDIEIVDFAPADVCEWVTRDPIDKARNPLGLLACIGDELLLGWDAEQCDWYVKQVQTHVSTFIEDILCDSEECAITAKVKSIGHQSCDCDEEDTYIALEGLTMSEIDIPTGATCNEGEEGCQAILETTRYCLLNCGTPTSGSDIDLPMLELDIPTDIECDHEECALELPRTRYCVIGCASTGEPEPLSQAMTEVDVPNGVSWNAELCRLEIDTMKRCILQCDAEAGPPWLVGGVTVDVPQNIESDVECNIGMSTKRICMLGSDLGAGDPVSLASLLVEVEMPTGFQVGCDYEEEEEEDQCQASMTTKKLWVLGCDPIEAGDSISLANLFVQLDIPTGNPTTEEVLDEHEEVIGCNEVQATTRYCVIGCELGAGDDIETPLMEIAPVTDGVLDERGEDLDLCWTPKITPVYVRGGCSQEEFDGGTSCVFTTDCEEEEEE